MVDLNALYELSEDLTVLYIEDHDDTREELHELLETIFPKIFVATNGLEGLDVYKNNDIDLIITDINMPKMDGITMIEEIRKEDSEVKIVVFSAHERTDYLSKCIYLDVDGFLVKPLDQNKYYKTLHKVVEQIVIKKELNDYKKDLEKKVQEQLDELVVKNTILEKNAKLATMGEMIDAIAHQWKTPLNVISMYIDFTKINSEANSLKQEELLENLDKMTYQVKHLFETIEEFRGFFRPNSNLQKVSVKKLIDSTLLLLNDELIRCTVSSECSLEEDCFITVNQNEFKHVLINLIQNSKDAFIQNKIEKRKIEFHSFKQDGYVYIQIKDNAGGIPKDVIDEIFIPHFTTKEDDGGTGIGLYLTKQILDKVDGTIGVKNIENGACFEIRMLSQE